MAFQINTNIGALKAYNALAQINADTQKAQLRLATGKRINNVADDTSGYNIGKKLESSNLKMKAQLGNIGSAQNYLSTAESALQQINDKINQITAKQVDATDPLKDQSSIANDIRTLASEIDSILSSTKIDNTSILTSASASSASFDAGGSSNTSLDFAGVGYLNATDITAVFDSSSDLQNATDGTVIAASVSTAQTQVRNALGRIGNLDQTLSSRQDFLTSAVANNTASISRLFDADMAEEQLNATKGQIQNQVATSMLSQLNSAPQQILSLFR